MIGERFVAMATVATALLLASLHCISGQSPRSIDIAEQKCSMYAETVKVTVYRQPLVADITIVPQVIDRCGHKAEGLVSGGVPAGEYEFPHQAQLGVSSADFIDWKCGGTLISPEYILSAAHCEKSNGLDMTYAWLGSNRIHDGRDMKAAGLYRIAMFFKHPQYGGSEATYNDIALVKLAKKARFSRYIRPACLPTTFDGDEQSAFVSGWGQLEFLGQTPEFLQKAKLEKYSFNECAEHYREDSNLPRGLDDQTQLCAGSHNSTRDTCQGDSGGPLQVYNKNKYCMYTVIGVTSLGGLCGTQVPGVYTRVYAYLDWIVGIVFN